MILTAEIWNLSILHKAAFPHAGTLNWAAWYIPGRTAPHKIVLQPLTDTSSSSFLSDHGNKVGLMHNKRNRSKFGISERILVMTFFLAGSSLQRTILVLLSVAMGSPVGRTWIWSSVYCYRNDCQASVPGKISHKVCCSVKPKPRWDYTATGRVTWHGHWPKRN